MDHIIKSIYKHQNFAISSHRDPDGDSIGSCIALGLALKKLGKSVTYIMDDIPDKFEFLDEISHFKTSTSEDFDVFICLDCSNTEHLHNKQNLSNSTLIINIDHHISNTNYGGLNYVDATASATGEIIYKLIDKMSLPIDKDMAIALYTAIVTDTGNFKYSNVTHETHAIISELYKITDIYWEINTMIFDQNSYERMKIIGKSLEKLYLTHENKISVISLSLEDLKEYDNVDLEGIINYARDIKGVEVAVFAKEVEPNLFRVSFRSNGHYDVSALATLYGGGGHSKAAGCTIKGNSLEDIMSSLTITIAKDLE